MCLKQTCCAIGVACKNNSIDAILFDTNIS